MIGLIATLTYRHVEISSEAATAAVPAIPRLMVMPFSGEVTPRTSELAMGLTDEVVRQLASFKEIDIISGMPSTNGELQT